jgi:hypothetical protein
MFTRVLAVALALVAGPATADSMRCGSHLIDDSRRDGPGKYEVLKLCGEPTAREGNTWIYERGGSKRVVHFDDSGRVTAISSD